MSIQTHGLSKTNTDSWSYYRRGDRYDWTASTPSGTRSGAADTRDDAERTAKAALADLKAGRTA